MYVSEIKLRLDGSPTVQMKDQAIPNVVIEQLHDLQTRDGMLFEDALTGGNIPISTPN